METTGALEISPVKSPSVKQQILAPVVEKYSVAMQPILGNFWYGSKTISNILNSMMMFALPILDWKHPVKIYGV